ncbi:hypothetical protein ACHAPE_007374 [Trichoderma viride]
MKSSVEEPKYSFNEVEHEGQSNGSKNSKVEDDIARLESAVNALQGQVSQLSDERGLLKDNYDRLKRDNQRRIWEIVKLQGENRNVKEKCDQTQQENLTLKTKSTEFRAAINKLQGENRDVKQKCDQIQQENVTLRTKNERKNTEFRAAINDLQDKVRDNEAVTYHLKQTMLKTLRSRE